MCFRYLKPDHYHKKYKTNVKWKNLNPIFNEEFVFETKMTDLPQQTLVLTVWDKDYGKSNDYLGKIFIYSFWSIFVSFFNGHLLITSYRDRNL